MNLHYLHQLRNSIFMFLLLFLYMLGDCISGGLGVLLKTIFVALLADLFVSAQICYKLFLYLYHQET